MDRGAGWAIVHRVTKELDMTKWLNNQGFISEQKDQNTGLRRSFHPSGGRENNKQN